MRGSRDSGGFQCGSSEYVGTPKVYKARRTGFSNSERCTAPNSALGVSQILGSGLDLLGGILKLISELRYKG